MPLRRALALGAAAALFAAAPARAWDVVPEARAALWLVQEASKLHSTHPSPGLRASLWAWERARLDAGYQFTWDDEGTERLQVSNTFHAFTARALYVLPLERGVSLLAGAGPALTLQTSRLYDSGRHAPTIVTSAWGYAAAAGAEAIAGRFPVRFEVEVLGRGSRVDLLFGMAVGFK